MGIFSFIKNLFTKVEKVEEQIETAIETAEELVPELKVVTPKLKAKVARVKKATKDAEGCREVSTDPYKAAPLPSQGKKKTLTELANDDEFSMRAERFLEGVGRNEDIFEYLRDAD